jgi:hypothetical protein
MVFGDDYVALIMMTTNQKTSPDTIFLFVLARKCTVPGTVRSEERVFWPGTWYVSQYVYSHQELISIELWAFIVHLLSNGGWHHFSSSNILASQGE